MRNVIQIYGDERMLEVPFGVQPTFASQTGCEHGVKGIEPAQLFGVDGRGCGCGADRR